MNRIDRSRACAAISQLEGRCLLSGAAHGISAEMMAMKAATMVSLASDSISNNMKQVSLVAEVKASSMGGGVPTGNVVFEMIMPRGTKMPGMHAGVNKLGTVPLQSGEATLTVKASDVLGMELKIIYKGNSDFESSSVTPPMLTMSGLIGSSDMGGMTM